MTQVSRREFNVLEGLACAGLALGKGSILQEGKVLEIVHMPVIIAIK